MEVGKVFLFILQSEKFPGGYVDQLLSTVFEVCDNDTWELLEVWVDIFDELLVQISTPKVLDLMNKVFELANVNQPDNKRAAGGQMLGALIKRLAAETPDQVIRKLSVLSQDPENLTRKRICKALSWALLGLEQERILALSYKIVELVRDETQVVFSEALPLFCQLCSKAKVPEALTVSKEILSFKKPDFALVVISSLGELMHSLKDRADEEFKENCVLAIERHIESDVLFRLKIAYNFPGIVLTLGTFNSRLLAILQQLAADEAYEVREIVAKSLHEIPPTECLKEFDEILTGFLKEESLQKHVVPYIWKLSQVLKKQSKYLVLLNNISLNTENWRVKNLALSQLKNFIPHTHYTAVSDLFLDPMMTSIETDPHPVRQNALDALAMLYREVYVEEDKQKLSYKVIDLLAKSESSKTRALFIDFCVYVRKYCSRTTIYSYFINDLFYLAEDPVLEVRLKFAQNFVQIRYLLHPDDSEFRQKWKSTKDKYLNTGCYLIQDAVIEAEEALTLERSQKEYNQDEEQRKIDYEKMLQEKHAKENEDKIKAMVDSLISRGKKNNLVNSLKRNTESHKDQAKNLPVRKSFSDADKYERYSKKKSKK